MKFKVYDTVAKTYVDEMDYAITGDGMLMSYSGGGKWSIITVDNLRVEHSLSESEFNLL